MHQIVHFRKLPARNVSDDAVKCVVAGGLARSLAHPRVEGLAQGLAFVLNREVDQRGCASESGGPRTGLEVVRTGRAAERHVEMSVNVDPAGQDQLSRCVQNLAGVLCGKFRSNGGDLPVYDGDVRGVSIGCGHHRTVSDDRVETHRVLRRFGAARLAEMRKAFYATLPPFSYSHRLFTISSS